MWKNKTIIWVETKHQWDLFGKEVSKSDVDIDMEQFDAKGIYIWKSKKLDEFIDDGISLFERNYDVFIDPNIVSGFFVAISVICLAPLEVKIIQDDDQAKQFLNLVIKEKGQHYLLESELNRFPKIESLIEHFIDLKLLARKDDKLIVQGKILNRVHIK